MGNHFCEQDTHAKISRRKALKGLLTGAAIGVMPAHAEAAQALSDEEQVNACVGQLRDLLQRMHPLCDRIYHHINEETDGTFRLSIQGARRFLPFSGDGLYEISMSGYLMKYWMEKSIRLRIKDGTPIPGTEFYRCTQFYDGEFVDDVRDLYEPNIVRKLADSFDELQAFVEGGAV